MTFDGVLALRLSTWRTCICGVLYQYISCCGPLSGFDLPFADVTVFPNHSTKRAFGGFEWPLKELAINRARCRRHFLGYAKCSNHILDDPRELALCSVNVSRV